MKHKVAQIPIPKKTTITKFHHVVFALGTVYLVWGSTYLGIRIAIESIPPFLMAGSRFIIAGVLMYLVARMRGASPPTRREWRDAFIIGVCLVFAANGAVTYAEQFIPSGLTALLIATVPFFLTLFAWWSGITGRPTLSVCIALVVGLAGVGILMLPHSNSNVDFGKQHEWWLGVSLLLFACISWSGGSLYSRRAAHPKSSILGVGMQMIAGGLVLSTVSIATGEFWRFSFSELTARAAWSWFYLMSIGAIVGYSAYIWLIRRCAPSLVGTYAFVNPVIAVFLGWIFAGEHLDAHTLLGATVVLIAVAVIVLGKAATGDRPR